MKYHPHLVEKLKLTLDAVFQENRHADKLIEKELKTNPKWGSRDRRFFAETVYDVVRWYRKLEFYAEHLSMPFDLHWRMLWVYFIQKNQEAPKMPKPYDESKAKEELQRAQTELQKHPRRFAIEQSYPDWWEEYGRKNLGDQWEAIAISLNQPASIYLRTNTLKSTPSELKKKLSEEEVLTEMVKDVEGALVLPARKNVFITKAFQSGLFEMQDAASQLVAPFLNPKPGERVIDACAGAGGKSLHLAALMKNKGRIISLDIHQWKLDELKKRARRNGVDIIETRFIENSKVVKRLAEQADALLLDVPCTGSGVIRRNPDTKWKLSLQALKELTQTQHEIISHYSSMVKKGGRMVYATCSLFPEENHLQVQKFIQQNPEDWKLEKEMSIFPHIQGFDGFYAALLVRKA